MSMETKNSNTVKGHDEKKEEAEAECLQHAIDLGINQPDKTGEILRYLNGEVIPRTKGR